MNANTANAANAQYTPMIEADAGDDLPLDLMECKHAARIAKIHISGVKRWILRGRLRGWKRAGRLFVSRAELMALFQPVPTAADVRETLPATRRELSARERWVDSELRALGVRK